MKETAKFTPIHFETWHRREYFEYYYYQIKCKYTLNANIDVSKLLEEQQKRGLKFYPTFLYVIMRAINQNREFRMSFENGVLGYWNFVVPSYTIFHNDDKTFSDIWSEYDDSFTTFYRLVTEDMQRFKDVKQIKAKPGQPSNFCSISSLPWLSFTSFSQDTYTESDFLFPLIRFGKYFEENGKVSLPLAVFVNHAVADGYHTSKLINDIEYYAMNVDDWIDK